MNAVWPENAPGTFQRVMNILISSAKCQFALVYLDDRDNFKVFRRMYCRCMTKIEVIERTEVNIEDEKSAFSTNSENYLVVVITSGCLTISSHTIDAVLG